MPEGLNAVAWDLFLSSDNKTVLETALEWINLSIKLDRLDPERQKSEVDNLDNINVQLLDTKANLLYKLGKVNEAIELEQKALELDIARAQKIGRQKGDFFDIYTSTISKMIKGQPTW